MNQENTPKIEIGIPIPPYSKHGRGWAAMLKVMKAGDSFIVPFKAVPSVRTVAHRLQIKVTIRNLEEETYRVWKL